MEMNRLTEPIRIIKTILGIALILAFFLPWVAQTPGCADKTVIIRDNISGFSLAYERTAPESLIAPIFGLLIIILAFAVRGKTFPLSRSLVSLVEIPVAMYLLFYLELALRLFTPFIVRFGYYITESLFWAIPVVSLSEVVVHFPRLTKNGKVIVATVITGYIAIAIIEFVSRHGV
jgi:hypothetical protein